jgi:hypothetical protein
MKNTYIIIINRDRDEQMMSNGFPPKMFKVTSEQDMSHKDMSNFLRDNYSFDICRDNLIFTKIEDIQEIKLKK